MEYFDIFRVLAGITLLCLMFIKFRLVPPGNAAAEPEEGSTHVFIVARTLKDRFPFYLSGLLTLLMVLVSLNNLGLLCDYNLRSYSGERMFGDKFFGTVTLLFAIIFLWGSVFTRKVYWRGLLLIFVVVYYAIVEICPAGALFTLLSLSAIPLLIGFIRAHFSMRLEASLPPGESAVRISHDPHVNAVAASGCAFGCCVLTGFVVFYALAMLVVVFIYSHDYGGRFKKPWSSFTSQSALVHDNIEAVRTEISEVPRGEEARERIAAAMWDIQMGDRSWLDNDSLVMYEATVRDPYTFVAPEVAGELRHLVFEENSTTMAERMVVARYYANATPVGFADAVIGFDVITRYMFNREMSVTEVYELFGSQAVDRFTDNDRFDWAAKQYKWQAAFLLSVVLMGIIIITSALSVVLRRRDVGAGGTDGE